MDTEYNADRVWEWQELVRSYVYNCGLTNHKSSWAWFLWHMRMCLCTARPFGLALAISTDELMPL